ncbi:MAG: DDE-type integrase/transposase/recombinase, partial [Alphaproteobacteria bacterium]|nr:DDE-type integrase/transposase/recombinase [Alphaproteobacteria bacterium]
FLFFSDCKKDLAYSILYLLSKTQVTYLLREHGIYLSFSTIWRLLNKAAVKPLKRYRSPRKSKRYSRGIPGERVQMDVTKVQPKCYQCTAIDDCTRLRVLRLYSEKTAANAVFFFGEVLRAFPFPIQRIQTDWGTEFFNEALLMVHYVKFRPIKPRTPHLNGKIERSQQTDKAEFYSLLNLKNS